MDNLTITTKKDALGYTGVAYYYGEFLCSASGKTKARAEKETRQLAQQEVQRQPISAATPSLPQRPSILSLR